MDDSVLIGTLGFALGGAILFFVIIFVINQAQVPSVNITLLASIMSFFAFFGFLLIGLGLNFIFKSATKKP